MRPIWELLGVKFWKSVLTDIYLHRFTAKNKIEFKERQMAKFQKTKGTLYIQIWNFTSENARGAKIWDTFAKRDALKLAGQFTEFAEIKDFVGLWVKWNLYALSQG